MSYEEVALLVERTSGERLLSDRKIGQIVSAKALEISQEIYKNTRAILAQNDDDTLAVNPIVDIYNCEEKEILLCDDGIQGNCVKKPNAKSSQKRKIRVKSSYTRNLQLLLQIL